MKTKRIGAFTLYEGRNGRWVGVSGPEQTDTFERMIRGEVSTAEYVRELHQRVCDRQEASRLLGKRA